MFASCVSTLPGFCATLGDECPVRLGSDARALDQWLGCGGVDRLRLCVLSTHATGERALEECWLRARDLVGVRAARAAYAGVARVCVGQRLGECAAVIQRARRAV